MNRTRRHIKLPFLATLLAFALLLAVLPMTVFATPSISGTTDIWGWELLGDGSLSITGCTAATGALTIPTTLAAEGSLRNVTEIASFAFERELNLTSVVLPEGLATIRQDAFRVCSALTSVDFPDSLRVIENGAFHYCSALTKVELNEGLTTLGAYAFADSDLLAEIVLPDSVTSLGSYVFAYNPSLVTCVLPHGITTLSEGMFVDCTALVNQVLPAGLTEISTKAFSGCSSLTTIDIPDGIETIGTNAFANCTALAAIVLPMGVTEIGDGAFMNCTALASVTVYYFDTTFGVDSFDGDLKLSLPETGGFFGYSGSTAHVYADLDGFNFQAITVLQPILEIEDTWTACFRKSFVPGDVLGISGIVYGYVENYEYKVFAWVDDRPETLVATFHPIPLSSPSYAFLPIDLTADFTLSADLANGPHWLTVVVRNAANGVSGVPQHIYFTSTGAPDDNPQTSDRGSARALLAIALALVSASTLVLLRRGAKA